MDIDAYTYVKLPLWATISGLTSIIGFIVGAVWWFLVTFMRKSEAREAERALRAEMQNAISHTDQKVDDLSKRMNSMEKTVHQISNDTAFIRGILSQPLTGKGKLKGN